MTLDTGVLYCDDNLARLTLFPDCAVDLIYLDPPFFSNRVYEVIWGDEAEVRSFEDRWEGGMQHYLGWMRERVEEMHRVLKPTGLLYLHCDPHASHYLKVMLDEVFNASRFVSEIVWKRTSAHNRVRRFGPVHDLILVYSKSTRWTWNPTYVPYDPDYAETNFRRQDEEGRHFSTADLTSNNPGSRYVWKGKLPPGERYWGVSLETMQQHEADGRLYYTRNGLPRLKNYRDQMPGQLVQDVWTDIRPLHANAREREGWPTQKPEPLLERILGASTNPGDIVLDPFCGCGTTVAVAERMGRRWAGIDISLTAIDIMERRLLKSFGHVPAIVNAPSTVDALKRLKPFEFQNWAISAINGTHSPRRTGDMGIDGHWFFTRDPVQVKQSEHVGRNVIDNFETAIRRAGRNTGYVIAFSFTRGAVDEVARARGDGLTIHLVKAAQVLLMRGRRFGQIDLPGPQPQNVEELPLPPVRKPSEMPTAEELIASDQAS